MTDEFVEQTQQEEEIKYETVEEANKAFVQSVKEDIESTHGKDVVLRKTDLFYNMFLLSIPVEYEDRQTLRPFVEIKAMYVLPSQHPYVTIMREHCQQFGEYDAFDEIPWEYEDFCLYYKETVERLVDNVASMFDEQGIQLLDKPTRQQKPAEAKEEH